MLTLNLNVISSPKESDIIEIPIELVNQFVVNPLNALRDYASIPTDAITPFFTDLVKLEESCKKEYHNPFDSIERSFDSSLYCDDDFFRYMHVDLAKIKDGLGISMCHIPYWIKTSVMVENKEAQRYEEMEISLPYIKFDFIGRVVSQDKQEILISTAQDLIFELSQNRNFYIHLITFDRFESTQTIQTLRENGYNVSHLSVDRTAYKVIVDFEKDFNIRKDTTEKQYNAAFEILRYAISDSRIYVPYHEDWEKEGKGLEYLADKDVVIKSPHSTDDLMQSCAGSAFNACNNEVPDDKVEEETDPDTTYDRKDMQSTIDYNQLNEDRYSNYSIGMI